MVFDPGFGGCVVLSLVSAIIFMVVYLIRRGSGLKYLFGALFSTYMIFAVSRTMCPIYFHSGMREIFAEQGWKITDCMLLVPFEGGVMLDDWLNVLLTFPFGFMLPLIKRRFTWRHAAVYGLGFGLTVELTQLLTALLQGFTFRYVDTSDVICNFAGTMLGWALSAAFILLVQRKHVDGGGSLVRYISERTVFDKAK